MGRRSKKFPAPETSWTTSPVAEQQNVNLRTAPTVVTMPVSKATKKFEKNKLGDVIKARKNVAKIKQRKQMDAKKKQRKVADNAKAEDLEEEGAKKPKKSTKEDRPIPELPTFSMIPADSWPRTMGFSTTKWPIRPSTQ